MRLPIAAAFAACTLFAAPAPAFAQSASFPEADLVAYNDAMSVIMPINEAAAGSLTTEQQAQMAQAVTDAGLTVDQFNAIATAAQSDAAVRAQLDLLAAPAPVDGSVSASVSDAEVTQFAQAMVAVREASGGSSTPSAEQQAAMGDAATSTGLTVERFNEIGAAVGSEEHLRARVALAEAEING